jgi:hypothetical protein
VTEFGLWLLASVLQAESKQFRDVITVHKQEKWFSLSIQQGGRTDKICVSVFTFFALRRPWNVEAFDRNPRAGAVILPVAIILAHLPHSL